MSHCSASLLLSCLLCCLLTVAPNRIYAQSGDDAEVLVQGKRYLDINLRSLSKYEHRLEHRQQKLLSRLKTKEQRFEQALKKKDSLAWARLQEQRIGFDSISRLSRVDSSAQMNRLAAKPNAVIDSLKGVTGFLQKTSGKSNQLGQTAEIGQYNSELTALKGKLNYRQYIDELIAKRTSELKSAGNGSVPGLGGIEQQVFYARAQMKAYKAMAEDPGKLEEKAYEFLQGQAGFEEGVDKAVNGNNPLSAAAGGNLSVTDLEKMGYQTKQQLNASLQQKFGSNVSTVQQQMSSQVSNWQKEAQNITSQVKQAKQSLRSIKQTAKPSFKINPMRCLPFWSRIEKSYDIQTARAVTGIKPATVNLGGTLGYKQTPKLTAGVGVSTSFGVGYSWDRIHPSFEGIGLRVFSRWELIYGIGVYAGYERIYNKGALSFKKGEDTPILPSIHNTNIYNENALLGLSKSYKLNTKTNGAVQVLYDFWWREKQLTNPIIIRFTYTNI